MSDVVLDFVKLFVVTDKSIKPKKTDAREASSYSGCFISKKTFSYVKVTDSWLCIYCVHWIMSIVDM